MDVLSVAILSRERGVRRGFGIPADCTAVSYAHNSRQASKTIITGDIDNHFYSHIGLYTYVGLRTFQINIMNLSTHVVKTPYSYIPTQYVYYS